MYDSQLPFAENQQCKIAFSHIEKVAVCCKSRTQVTFLVADLMLENKNRIKQTNSISLAIERERRPGTEEVWTKT